MRTWILLAIASLALLPHTDAYPTGIKVSEGTENGAPGETVLKVFLVISAIFIISPYFIEFATASAFKSNPSTTLPSISRFFTTRNLTLYTATFFWTLLSVIATYQTSAPLRSTSLIEPTSKVSSISSDIAGIGVRSGIWISGVMVIITAILGHFHAEDLGTKEISLAVLVAQVYYTVNILVAYKTGLSAADMLAAAMILDTLISILSVTFSMKDCLVSRQLLIWGLSFQLFAISILAFVVAKLPAIGGQEATENKSYSCFQAYWWGPVDTCTGVSWKFWLYYCLRSVAWAHGAWLCLSHMSHYDAAEKTSRGDDNTDIVLESSVYHSISATTFTKYWEWTAIFICSVINIELTLQRYRLQGFEDFDGWGQTTPIIVAAVAFSRWCYAIYCIFQKENAKRRNDILGNFNKTFPALYRAKIRCIIRRRCFEILDKKFPNHPFGRLPLRAVNHARIQYTQFAWTKEFHTTTLRWPTKNAQELSAMLIEAAEFGDLETVKDLLKEGAGVCEVNQESDPAIIRASINGHASVVNHLLREGAEADIRGVGKLTALYHAASDGHEELVKVLLENGADVNSISILGRSPLHQAASRGHNRVVKMLLDKGAEVDKETSDEKTALHEASTGGHTAVVALLLEGGAEIDNKGIYNRTALHEAASRGHEAVVKLLLDEGAGVDKRAIRNQTALHEAACRGDEGMVKLLLEGGANMYKITQGGKTALHEAADNGHEAVVKLLLNEGMDVEKEAKDKRTALHGAAYNGHEAVVKLLLEVGAEVDKEAKNERTALHEAAFGGHEAVVRLLLEEGADVNKETIYNQSALHEAACRGHEAVVKLLLEEGADVDKETTYSQTALHKAAYSGCEAVVKLLLEAGAVTDKMDDSGHIPRAWAVKKGNNAVVKLLE